MERAEDEEEEEKGTCLPPPFPLLSLEDLDLLSGSGGGGGTFVPPLSFYASLFPFSRVGWGGEERSFLCKLVTLFPPHRPSAPGGGREKRRGRRDIRQSLLKELKGIEDKLLTVWRKCG